jgi:hypothetical protein
VVFKVEGGHPGILISLNERSARAQTNNQSNAWQRKAAKSLKEREKFSIKRKERLAGKKEGLFTDALTASVKF